MNGSIGGQASSLAIRSPHVLTGSSFETDYEIITSFPGLADSSGAVVLGELGDGRSRFADDRALEAFAGSAPVTKASGKSRRVVRRRTKNNRRAGVGYPSCGRRPPATIGSRTGTTINKIQVSTDSGDCRQRETRTLVARISMMRHPSFPFLSRTPVIVMPETARAHLASADNGIPASQHSGWNKSITRQAERRRW